MQFLQTGKNTFTKKVIKIYIIKNLLKAIIVLMPFLKLSTDWAQTILLGREFQILVVRIEKK